MKTILSSFKNRPKFTTAAAIFLGVLGVYLFTLYPTVTTEDSGELVAVSYLLDIAHPPGYPLYTLIAKLFTFIIPFGNIAWRVNVMSAVFGALTVMMVFLLLTEIGKSQKLKNYSIAVGVSLLFAFTNTFWSQAIRAEVYTLHTFFFVLILLTAFLWNQQKEKNKLLYLTIFLIGLSLGNHHLMVMVVPPMILLILMTNWRLIIKPLFYLKSLLSGIAGLLIYLYLPIRSHFGPYENPAMVYHPKLDAPNHVWDFVNRKIYGGTTIEKAQLISDSSSTATEATGISDAIFSFLAPVLNPLSAVVDSFYYRLRSFHKWDFGQFSFVSDQFLSEYYYLTMILFGVAIYLWLKRRQAYGIFLLVLTFFTTYLTAAFLSLWQNQSSPLFLHQTKPFYLPGTIIVAIGTWYALSVLMKRKKHQQQTLKALSLVIFVVTGFIFAKNLPHNYQRDNYLAYDLNKAILHSLPAESALASAGRDNFTFPFYYLQRIENFRPDAKVRIVYVKGPNQYTLRRVRLEESGTDVFTDILFDNYRDIGLVPHGILYKFIDRDFHIDVKECLHNLGADIKSHWSCFPDEQHLAADSYNFRGLNKKHLDYYNEYLKGVILVKQALNFDAEGKTTHRDQLLNRLVTELDKNNIIINWIGDYYRDLGQYQKAQKAYEKALSIWPVDKKTASKLKAVQSKLQ